MSWVISPWLPVRDFPTSSSGQALRGVGGIILNAEGKRFCNELGRVGPSVGSSEKLGLIYSKTSGVYALFLLILSP